MIEFRGTTICAVKKDGVTAIAGDGQVTMGESVIFKNTAVKVRRIFGGKVILGFAGSVTDAFALTERFEGMLNKFGGNLMRSAVELAELWRSDKIGRKLDAMMITADENTLLILSGTGEVIEPDEGRKYIDIAAVDPYVDFVNVMTYDMDSAPSHQSALRDKSAYVDCERAIKAYTDAGVAASKLVLGIPFYGRMSFDKSPGAIDYNKIIMLDKNDYKIDNWDSDANVPYVTYKGTYYCGYDNEKSIAIKGDWIRSLGMKGMMYWDYNADDNQHTLCKAVWQAVMK